MPLNATASGILGRLCAAANAGRGERFEHEDLDSEVGVEVVVAHEADHLASGELFDLPAELDAHDALPASAQIEHGLALAGVREALLAAREAVLEHDEDAVVAERGFRPRGPAAGGARKRPHDRIGDPRCELPVVLSDHEDRLPSWSSLGRSDRSAPTVSSTVLAFHARVKASPFGRARPR